MTTNDANQHPAVAQGMRLGFQVSLILAVVYAVLGLLGEVGWQIWLTQDLLITNLPIARFAGMLPFYFLLALGPALMLGTLTGGLIGELWVRNGRRADRRLFAVLALALCIGIVVGLHIVYQIPVDFYIPSLQLNATEWPEDTLGFLLSYIFTAGIPSMLYAVTSLWGGYFFWKVRQQDMNNSP